ncbi:MAG: hypothetical protein U0610_09485 [bacterium]
MKQRGRLGVAALVLLLALGCASSSDSGLIQDGPVLRTIASDGSLVVEGRAFNLSEHALEAAQVEIAVRRDDRQPIVVVLPLGAGGRVGAFETVSFRVETGIRADASAEVSVTFAPGEAP